MAETGRKTSVPGWSPFPEGHEDGNEPADSFTKLIVKWCPAGREVEFVGDLITLLGAVRRVWFAGRG